MNNDIIVIGAGLAGLYTAHLLQKKGYNVTVLEARDRVGGRTFTDNGVDLGGQWVSSLQKRIIKLCEELNIAIYRQYDTGINIVHLNHKRSEYTDIFRNAGLDNDKQFAQLNSHINNFDILAKTPKLLETLQDLDRISFHDWCQENISDSTIRSLINYAYYVNTCIDPKHVSFFFWIYFLKVCGGYNNIMSIKDGAQEFRIAGGSQSISNKLAQNLNIIFNSQVNNILKNNDKYTIITSDNKNYFAKKVICALPATLIPKLTWSPPLEPARINFYNSMKMGSVTKVVIEYEYAFWRQNGYSGAIICDEAPVRLCYDACTDNYKALVLFIMGDEEHTDLEILNHLAILFKNDLAKKAKNIYKKNWAQDGFSGGCYFAAPAVDNLVRYHSFYTKPYDNIYFVGTETASEWAGYMEGALESAERVLQQIGEDHANEAKRNFCGENRSSG